jgi:dynein heavy chain 2
MGDDVRTTFIAVACSSIGSARVDKQQIAADVIRSKEVSFFLDDGNCKSLKATVSSSGTVEFTTELNSDMSRADENSVDVLFVRRVPEPITESNLYSAMDVQTVHGSPLDGLYHTLRAVWCPTLLDNSKVTDKLPPKVVQLLSELEQTLGSSSRGGLTSGGRGDDELNDISTINDPYDEICFWQNVKGNRRSDFNDLGKAVEEALADIAEFSDLDALEFSSVSDLVNKTFDALNSAWLCIENGASFPQKRMEHFFDVIGKALCRYIQRKLGGINIWSTQTGEARIKLQAAAKVCEQWCEVPRKLTKTFWPGSDHAWKGGEHTDTYMEAFKGRVEHVLRILTLSDELSQLMTEEERSQFQLDRLFAPLETQKPLLYNPYSEPVWVKAVAEYENSLMPVESAVASHFRRNVASMLDNAQLLLREFQKYRNILGRDSIRRALVQERDVLLTLLKDYLKQLESAVDRVESGQDDYNDGSGEGGITAIGRARLLSPRLAGIVYLRQISAKVVSVMSTTTGLLDDLDSYERFRQQCQATVSRIKAEEDARFDGWLTEMQDRIDDDDDSLRLSGALMGWKEGVLVVNFSDSLVQFLREVRQLDEMGFDIPRTSGRKSRKTDGGRALKVADKAFEAEKYYRYGILLKKTANFYNSISDQMIDVQEQLLLDSLSAFAGIVSKPSLTRDEGDVSWANSAECENYIRALQDAAEKLSSENRYLRKVHESLCDQTVGLMSIDLLRSTETWKTKWRGIKEKMQSVTSRYSEKDSRMWVTHWDYQIFKALEASYQIGLESLNENLPEIRIDMVFVSKRLDLKPSLAQVRQSYYHEMKKFAGMPNAFDGFGGNPQIYRKMGSANSKRLVKVYQKAEDLFARIGKVLKRYEPMTQLGSIDLDAYVEKNVKTPMDFLCNFKALKTKRKDIDKLPDVEKVDCCTINLTPFKGFLEDLLQRVGDALLITLRRSLLSEFKEVDTFLENANERLSTRPHSVEEISNAQKGWKDLDTRKEEIKASSKACVEKKKILLQYAPGTAVDVSEVTQRMVNLDGEGGRWDDFDIGMEAFNDMIEEQKEALKGTLEEDTITLNQQIDKFGNRWRQLKPTEVNSWEYSEIERIFAALEDWKTQFAELELQANTLTDNMVTFGMTKPRFDGLEELVDDLAETNRSWDMLKAYYEELNAMAAQDWLTFSVNVYALQDFATKWADNLKETFAKGSYDSVADHIISTVDMIKKSVPCLKYCRGEPFKEDHWTELLQGKLRLDREVRRENVKVEHFISTKSLEILMEPQTLSFVKNLNARALGEVQIREALQELRAWERSAEIKLLTSEESGRRNPLIKDWKDLFLEMGDKQSLLSSLKESEFFKAFQDQGTALEVKMSTLDFVLHTLNNIQRKWVYLEPIFGRGALPSEEARFRRVDEDFTDIMAIVMRDPKLFYLADEQIFPHLSDKLRTMLDQLERCQKALTDFLEQKRSAMPRFYFIGDDDLLEILGQAKNPLVIQSHLKKLFQGIHKVQFNDDSATQITAMVSSAGEVVPLNDPVPVNERVEDWLELLAKEMRATLAYLLSQCLSSKKFDWDYPSQVLCLAANIRFTDDLENALDGGGRSGLEKVSQSLKTQLRELTSHNLSEEPLLQLKMKSLVLDVVHNIDVVDQLLERRSVGGTDWVWRKQLRYYYENKKAVVRMHDASFEYTYEYQGNAPKLVHTPLTDKCYLTLTQGMHMGFGGNPYGPAGTGKTESVKALAACMGRQVLVFNCDEALESSSMVRIFVGIVKCGAWGCFDEFNRLKEDQLSAISQQIQVIQDSIKTKQSPITLLGKQIDVDFNSGIFVTLNPAGKGYGGRSRLPDNLKALFRPVAMGKPDNELIAEVSLVTEGFTQSKDLASKIVGLFNLSKQLLSPQQHYDWGLRALKAVLNSGGKIIQAQKVSGEPVTSEMEYEILIKAVRVNTLSKLTFSDTAKFLSLIGDVFPGVKSADITGGELEKAIREVIAEKPFNLIEDETQIKKMIQLKESLDQRMGCVVVGPSGCGKSTLWRVLKAAMVKCGQHVVTHVMNPKSMHRERLLGHMDIDTREWADGVLTDAARQVVRESADTACWVVCDGDVDPEWIESLNSVLDDNHLLTLPNGERINFGPNVNFLFETHDLRFASPATVSRMGMIFLSDEDMDVARVVTRWVNTFPQERRLQMSSWIDELFYKSLDYVLNACEYVIDTTMVGTVMSGLSQIAGATSRQEFICGLIRGIGGNLTLTARGALARQVFEWAGERPPDMSNPLDCYGDGAGFSSFFNSSGGDDAYIAPKDIGESAVVSTVTTQRTMKTMEAWIDNMEPFILVGPEGCGKSMIINHAFKQRRNTAVATIHCNAQTTADDIITKIAQTCSLFSAPEGRVYRPRDSERLVLYLKDINLPRPDMYDTCQLIAFLQQLITFGGFYDEELEFLRLERIQIVASMNAATTVGRHPLSTRFTAVVRVLVVDYPQDTELVNIYDAFLAALLSFAPLGDKQWLQQQERERLAAAVVEIYQRTREKFTVDDHRHYLFTPRDMTLLVKNLVRYDLASENLLDVVAHEACRNFKDRLVGMDAQSRFDQQLSGTLRSSFRHTIDINGVYFTSITGNKGGAAAVTGGESKEGDLSALVASVGGAMHRVPEADFEKMVKQQLMLYEREERDINMLLFKESMEHITQIDRTLSSFAGHALLAGRSGVGRRNAATIASYMLGYEFFTPAISRDYGPKQFVVDIKAASQVAGIKGEHVVLFLEDFQFTSDSMMEMVNSLLSSSEVPGMYTHEELEPMLAPLRELTREDGSFRTPYDFYLSRVRKYLHVIICMDPGHSKFLYRCESNPALYSKCNVQWIGEWRTSSLKEIPLLLPGIKSLLLGEDEDAPRRTGGGGESKGGESKGGESKGGESKGGEYEDEYNEGVGGGGSTEQADKLVGMVMAIHRSCAIGRGSKLGANPKDYVGFLKTWHSLHQSKKRELETEVSHLDAGLYKLDSASTVVNDLRTNAVQSQKDLAVAQTAADRAMDEISRALASSSDRRNEVIEIRKTVAQNEAETNERKGAIESELSEIQPILDEAKQAVGGIKPDHLNEIRSLTAPPEAIADVLAAVLTMLGVQDLSWLSMKKFLQNRGVKDDILNYDARRIDGELRKNVMKLIKKRSTSFEAENIRRVSVAAAPMAAWVLANIRYSTVLEKIQPLERDLEEQVYQLEQSQNRLRRCEEELSEIDVRVNEMKGEFADRTAEAERLKRNLAIAGETLDKAEGLIGQLSGEQERWKKQAQQLRMEISSLPLKMLLAAGFCTYLAKEPEDVRAELIAQWQEITGAQSAFAFKRTMSTESELLQWKTMGLPSDDLSQENALVITNASDRVPFIIDPASAATEWLKSMLSRDQKAPLEMVQHHDPRFSLQVELAVRFGKILVVLEVDGVEPMLYPLCRKDLQHQGARYVVSVGDKQVDYNEAFRLFLVTRNPSPDIPPDAAALVTQVNFTVTKSGLEGQLLGLAIQHEQPELEKAKGEMLRKEEDFKVQLAGLEKDLLQALATAEGNLLENASLIESLSRTKEKAAEIEEALTASAQASVKLDEQREVYRHFARVGSKLYFIVGTLQTVCHMYQFSLAAFLGLFRAALSKEMEQCSTEERLERLAADLEVKVLYFVSRALFKADRLMYALHLIKGMHPEHFQPKEWEIFTGSVVASVSDTVPRGFPSWAANDRQSAYRLLTEHVPHLIDSLDLGNAPKWSRFSSSLEAEKDIPAARGVSPWQKVLVVQAFRPDRLQSALTQFCTDLLRVESVSPPPVSMADIFNESNPNSPILLISSPGADASKELQEYATKTIGPGQYEELAMGGGQQDVAIALLRNAAVSGSWLCLKNLHLVVSWLPTLEKELSSMEPASEFRLWLTSEEHSSFPSILLQESLKATYESPPGIKKNLQRSLENLDQDEFDNGGATRARLLFLLSSFHAVVQERRTFLPQGWTKFYEFSYGDMKAGTYIMEAATAHNPTSREVDWEAVHGLMVDAVYGGRVDSAYDMRVLKSYLRYFFNEDVAGDNGAGKDIIRGNPMRMPPTPDMGSFRRIVNQLPDADAPPVFCLPDNIERSVQRNNSSAAIRQLRALSALGVEADKFDREKWRVQLGPILELWQQMVSSSPGVLAKRAEAGGGAGRRGGAQTADTNPVDDFVSMESTMSGALCNLVDSSLAALKKVLFGSGLLSPHIQTMATALLSGSVPPEWTKQWDGGPEKPQAWIRELVRKRMALSKWSSACAKGNLLDAPVVLGDLFNPATFINALRQQTARKLGCAIDRMKMVCAWEKDAQRVASICPLACSLSALLLQGADFQGGELQETAPEGSEIVQAPSVTIGFVSKDEQDPYSKERSIGVPTYFSNTREEFLMELAMPCGPDEQDRWVLAGVALFLTEDD